MKRTKITDGYAVSGLLSAEAISAAAAAGYKTLLSFLPDSEVAGSLSACRVQELATAAGLTFIHIPVAKYDLFSPSTVDAVREVLAAARGPVLGTCASGQRAAILWAAACAGRVAVPDILALATDAGFDFSFLRDDLESLADRRNWVAGDELEAA